MCADLLSLSGPFLLLRYSYSVDYWELVDKEHKFLMPLQQPVELKVQAQGSGCAMSVVGWPGRSSISKESKAVGCWR
jgi:hypothetical protein